MIIKVNNKEILNFRFILFLMVFYLFPVGDNFRMYVLTLFVVISITMLSLKKIRFYTDTFYMFVFFLFFLLIINIRFIVFDSTLEFYIREYTEVFRLLILLLLTMSFFNFEFKMFKIFYYFTIVYAFLDFSAVVAEMFYRSSTIGQFVITNYQSSKHALFTQYVKGLTTHGGLHGLVVMILFIFHFLLIPYVKNKKYPILACFFTAYIALVSGSRTHAGVLIIFLFIFLILSLSKKKKNNIQYYIIGIMILAGFILVAIYPEHFIKFNYLISNVQEGDSKGLGGRTEIWTGIINHALLRPYSIFIGWGKTFFLLSNGGFFTDNDYLAAIFVYGIIPVLAFCLLLINFLWKSLMNWKKIKLIEEIIFYTILCVSIASVASQGIYTFHWQVYMLLLLRFYFSEKRGEIVVSQINTL